MKKNDMILIGVLLAVSVVLYVFFFWGAEAGGSVRISVDGVEVQQLSLEENNSVTIETETGSNTIEVKDGYVRMGEADCRDQICVEHIKIQVTGETIVCLPHKLVVEIVGVGEEVSFDGVVG